MADARPPHQQHALISQRVVTHMPCTYHVTDLFRSSAIIWSHASTNNCVNLPIRA